MNAVPTASPAPGGARPTAADIQRLLGAQLSLPSRLGHTALLLTSLGAAGVVGALLATETGLPPRTRIAMAVLVAIGLSWAGFAAWVLARRRVLLAGHRVVAARMAIGFSSVFALGAWATGAWGGAGRPAYAAGGVGLVMLAVAVALHHRARRRVDELSRRRAELERRLGAGGGPPR
jgi:hypothetical protein